MQTVMIYVMQTKEGKTYASLQDLSDGGSESVVTEFPVILENGKSCLGVQAPNEDAWHAFMSHDDLYGECHFRDLLIEFVNAAYYAGVQHGQQKILELLEKKKE